MSDIDDIKSCLDVRDEHMARALAPARSLSEAGPRERTLALLAKMASVARPDAGAPRILVLLSRMARRDWIEGDLIVRIIGDKELAVLELMVDDGVSTERIAGPMRIDVPLDEFGEFLRKSRPLVAPLVPTETSARRLVLRGRRDLFAEQRKASISAFSVDLKQIGAEPPPRIEPPRPAEPPDEGPELIVEGYEKLPAILEFPEDLPEEDEPGRKG